MSGRGFACCWSVVALTVLVGCASGASTPTGGAAVSTRIAAGNGGFVLRPAPDARGCTPPRQVPDGRAPAAVAATLGVLRLPRTSVDGLPVLNRTDRRSSEDTGWLPARTIDYKGVRRRAGSAPAIYVVPSASVLELAGERVGAPCPSVLQAPVSAGACLVTGAPGGPLAVRCWTLGEIDSGRALTLLAAAGGHRLVGLVPAGHNVVIPADAGSAIAIRSPDGVVDQASQMSPGTRVLANVH
jgi:hypothetical protein